MNRTRRLLVAMFAIVVMAGGGLTVAPAPAFADEIDAWGYVYLDDPAQPIGEDYVPPLNRQATNAGAPATVTREGVGRYLVTFPDVASPDYGATHVTSDVPGIACQVEGGYNFFGDNDLDGIWDLEFGVRCRGVTSGAPANARFTAVFRTRLAPLAGTLPGAYAYVIADEPTRPSYEPTFWFSTSGTAPEVRKVPQAGRWDVYLHGAPFASGGGNVQVTPFHAGATCVVLGWGIITTATVVSVECRQPGASGTPTDTAMFMLSYARQRSLFGTTSGQFAYLRTDLPSAGPYWFSNTGALPTVTRSALTGVYDLTAPLSGPASAFTIQVTAIQPGNATCATTRWYTTTGGPTGTQAVGQVICRTPSAGVWADFSLAFST